jgi:hypothetical protein
MAQNLQIKRENNMDSRHTLLSQGNQPSMPKTRPKSAASGIEKKYNQKASAADTQSNSRRSQS